MKQRSKPRERALGADGSGFCPKPGSPINEGPPGRPHPPTWDPAILAGRQDSGGFRGRRATDGFSAESFTTTLALLGLVLLVAALLSGLIGRREGRAGVVPKSTPQPTERPPVSAPTPVRPVAGRDGASEPEWPGDSSGKPAIPDSERFPMPARDEEPEEDPERIPLPALAHLCESGERVILLDARTERSRNVDELQAKSALRLPPDHVAERATELGLPKSAWLISYCA
jgi:hypothetical protein